ncbi:MAG: DUF3795 domain-containing protein [Bacillota bacterium]
MSSSLVGKCGLYCGACTIYVAGHDSEEWRNKIARKHNCSPDQVRCNGCGDLTSACWGNGCKVVLCTRAKGYTYCHECPDYENGACERFEALAKSYAEVGVDLRSNLHKIKSGMVEEWLAESAERFKCPTCGRSTSVWFTECHHCGSRL